MRIKTDGILESGYLEEFINDAPFSPFPTVQTTDRPDTVAASLLEGRVAVLIDGTPMVLVVPATFIQFLQSSEDYYLFIVFTGIVIAYTVNNGVEVIARLTAWFFSIIVFSLILIIFLSAKDMNPDHLRPFLADGLKPVLKGSLAPYAWRGTIVVMAMLIPYVNQPQKI